jgi:CRISPR-associated endonuclease/helicase Cas3
VYTIDSRYATIVLPPTVGGLANGMLTGGPNTTADDVSCDLFTDKERKEPIRSRQEDDDEPPESMRLVLPLKLPSGGGDDAEPIMWYWFARPKFADDDGSKSFRRPITWQHHTDDVTNGLVAIADRLFPNDEKLRSALKLAAEWHDLGKKRAVWQRSIGNPHPTDWHAKSGRDPKTGRNWTPLDVTDYRHEFGSLLDVGELPDEHRDLILHLIAAHHGRARPHFDPDEAFDPERPQSAADDMAAKVPQRFARLQRKYGRWGLAYLESLLRAADWAASAKPSAFVKEGE